MAPDRLQFRVQFRFKLIWATVVDRGAVKVLAAWRRHLWMLSAMVYDISLCVSSWALSFNFTLSAARCLSSEY